MSENGLKIKDKKKSKNDLLYKDYIIRKIGMITQIVLGIIVLLLILLSMSNSIFMEIGKIIMGLLLLVMAYNNYKVYKRKCFTVIYIIVAIMTIFYGVFDLIK